VGEKRRVSQRRGNNHVQGKIFLVMERPYCGRTIQRKNGRVNIWGGNVTKDANHKERRSVKLGEQERRGPLLKRIRRDGRLFLHNRTKKEEKTKSGRDGMKSKLLHVFNKDSIWGRRFTIEEKMV